ncbi:GIY-YIG nuclease family protein [Streptomyces sp. NPDC090073]|uniref:GIY-YIG nuclease family protein n=1 Tax=Streptomyces sp. NPDC090073 TaxID=3365936 RepID=UPI003827ECD2
MTDPVDERAALYHLYDLTQGDKIPPLLEALYPPYLPLWKYLGTGQPTCHRVDTGFDYGPSGFEPDCPYEFGLEIRLREPEVVDGATRTALYRLRDASNRLLYVGVSEAPLRRWAEHSKDKPWWPLVTALTLQWFGTRTKALIAEAHAIRTERPLHNVAHNGDATPQ